MTYEEKKILVESRARISDLERQLAQLSAEVDEMREELKRRRGGRPRKHAEAQ